MVSADRLPAVNRLAATFVRPVFGGQSFCGGFCTGFLAVDRLCSDFCSSGFWWSIVLRRFLHRIFGCGSPLKRLLPVRFSAVNCLALGSAPDFWLSIAFAAISAARFWLHGFRGLPYRFCRTPAAAAVPVRSRQPRAVPGFRAVVHPNSGREFRRLPQKMLSH